MDEHRSHPSRSHIPREAGVIQRIRASLRASFPDQPTPFILVGCSGGRDSVALASMLHVLVRTGALRAALVHVDHAFREGSSIDARLVEAFGASLGLQVYVETLPSGSVSRHPGVGAEEALRRERYAAFARVSRRTGADAIALAHHQQDQAETVMLHLLRGAGLHGASGMRECSLIPVPWWDNTVEPVVLSLWRPFLREPVAVIDAWHREHGLPLAEDATNDDRRLRRNAVRLDILPALERLAPGAVANLARFAALAADDDELLDDIASAQVALGGGGSLHRSVLLGVPRPLGRRIVRRWILEAAFDGELSADRIDAVCEMAASNRGGATVELGRGWAVRIDRGVLSLAPPERVP